MPELRQNIVTKEWVIIASERARRPNEFAVSQPGVITNERNIYEPACPFCPGNEELDLEVERFPVEGAWQTRVVRNRYPALDEDGIPSHTFSGVQRRIQGVGYHEILVEHPHHNTTLALMTTSEVRQVLETFQRRGKAISHDPRIQHTIYFKNHGERAGASLQHPHCQIIALPVIPNSVRRRLDEVRRYFDDHGECAICTMLQDELTRRERLIIESKHFAAFILYAALSPFHMWIVPHRHCGCFLRAEPYELDDLANVLHTVLGKIYKGLHDPAYNMIIRTVPLRESHVFFHWYISIVPRVSRMAGFEMGSGMHINTCLPETCAEFLRNSPE
jgi:UDPglucose--hexose-1-phosphate uridylyltransferase